MIKIRAAILPLIVSVISIYSCASVGEKQTGNLPIIKLNKPYVSELEDIYLSEISDSISYVTVDESRLEYIHGVQSYEDKFVAINDDNCLLLYNADGTFVSKIGNVGKAHNEYLYPKWGIDSKNNKLYVVSASHNNSISQFELSTNTPSFIKMIDLSHSKDLTDHNFRYICAIDENILLVNDVSSDIKPEVLLYSPKDNSIQDRLPNYHNVNLQVYGIVYNSAAFLKYDKNIYYTSTYSDTLYVATDNKISPYMVFDTGDYKFLAKNALPSSGDKVMKVRQEAIRSIGLLRTPDHIYVKMEFHDSSSDKELSEFVCAVNLKDYSVRYCKPYFINDIDNGPDFSIYHGSWRGSGMVADNIQIVDMYAVKSASEEDREGIFFANNNMKKKLSDPDVYTRLYDKATENSNQLLQVLHLKK